jgi:small subunit ribosomal protein S21
MVYSLRLPTDPVGSWRGSRLTKVVVEPDESFESALKRFKKQCEKAGLLSEVKKRQHYEKPSARRKRKVLAARKKAKRRERTSD